MTSQARGASQRLAKEGQTVLCCSRANVSCCPCNCRLLKHRHAYKVVAPVCPILSWQEVRCDSLQDLEGQVWRSRMELELFLAAGRRASGSIVPKQQNLWQIWRRFLFSCWLLTLQSISEVKWVQTSRVQQYWSSLAWVLKVSCSGLAPFVNSYLLLNSKILNGMKCINDLINNDNKWIIN